jgi:hypothetical protein
MVQLELASTELQQDLPLDCSLTIELLLSLLEFLLTLLLSVWPQLHCPLICSPGWSGIQFATDSHSASTSWCGAALWGPWPDFTCSLVWHVLASSCVAPSLTRGRVCILQCTSLTGQSREGLIIIYYCLVWDWVPPFVASYDSRAYGGGIPTRLHTGKFALRPVTSSYFGRLLRADPKGIPLLTVSSERYRGYALQQTAPFNISPKSTVDFPTLRFPTIWGFPLNNKNEHNEIIGISTLVTSKQNKKKNSLALSPRAKYTD